MTASAGSSHDEAFGALAALSSALASSGTHNDRVQLVTAIRVAGDGVGFDSTTGGEPIPGHGSGMWIMWRQMDSIYGRVSVSSSVRERTVVRFRVPGEQG